MAVVEIRTVGHDPHEVRAYRRNGEITYHVDCPCGLHQWVPTASHADAAIAMHILDNGYCATVEVITGHG